MTYIFRNTNARPVLVESDEAAQQALRGTGPVLVVGEAALVTAPELRDELKRVAKSNPQLRADAIVLRRNGKHVFLARTNDDAHYYAVAELLRRWDCR